MAKKKKGELLPSGYLPVNRKLFNHPFWTEPRVFSKYEAWTDLLQTAWFGEKPGTFWTGSGTIEFMRGEIVASQRRLMKRWDWPLSKVTRFLDLCKKENMITTRIECGQTIISLVNYSVYNGRAESQQGTPSAKSVDKIETPTETPTETPEPAPVEGCIGTPKYLPKQEVNHERNSGGCNIKESIKKDKEEIQEPEAPIPSPDEIAFTVFRNWVEANAPRVNQLKHPITCEEYTRLLAEGFDKSVIADVLQNMQNSKTLLTKYVSANLTLRNWIRQREDRPGGKSAPSSLPKGFTPLKPTYNR